jgi:tetratricopeptide (TPR) repeat protein
VHLGGRAVKFGALFAIPLLLVLLGASSDQTSNAPGATSSHPNASTAQDSGATISEREKLQMRGDLYMARKDYSEAVLTYQRLLEQEPQNAEILNKIGISYQELGQDQLAERFYKKAMHADPNSSYAVNNLGTVEYARQRFGKAVRYYKKALQIAGEDNQAPIYSNMGYAYCNMKLYLQAMDSFSKALALDPNIFESKGTAGSLLQHRSTADPGTLYFLVAKSYAKLGDAEHAARYLKLARDDGYKNFLAAEKDPDFARVINDPQVQDVLRRRPPYEAQQDKPVTN